MGEPSNPSFSWFLGFRTCPRAPKPISFIFGDARILQMIQETPQILFGKYYFLKSQNVENSTFWKCWKRRGLKIMQVRLISSWKYGIWDQYLPENKKSKLGKSLKHWNQEPSKPRTFETKKLWNQETLKPRNQEPLPLNTPTPTPAHKWGSWFFVLLFFLTRASSVFFTTLA